MYVAHFLAAAGLLSGAVIAQEALPKRGVDCAFLFNPSKGDTCDTFANSWALTTAEFVRLNPGISCPSLDPSKQYCVLGTVSNDPVTTSSTSTRAPPPTTTAKTSTTTSTTLKPTTTTTGPAPSNSPAMPDIPSNCDRFHKIVSGDNCDALGTKYGISFTQIRSWNPEVNDKCTNLWLDYYVCVHVTGAATTTAKPPTTTTQNPPGGQPTNSGPQPQMPGIVSNCKKYHLVKEGEGCWAIYTNAGISFDQFRAYNTQIDAQCSNMWKDVYVCVGV
ncbi:peptidoglycan DL-endopeptidase LytF [Microdochium nivale]|nr:peptidoglycan DL-endopeptidase LytF [Microdochium nivale]